MTRLLRAKQCAELFGVHPNTWWTWVKQGKIPQGSNIGANTTVWRSDDLQVLMDRIAPRKIDGE
jgi:predicted DNA-binding transcriptional regulator AlpA